MRKLLFGTITIAIVAVIAYFLLGMRPPGQAAEPSPTATEIILPPATVANSVVADARVVPVQSAELSFPTGGVVAELPVTEGDPVTAGQLLVKLNSARQEASLAQAEAELRRAQASLAETVAGSREQEIAAAQAGVEAALAELEKIKQGAKPEDIEAAQASVAGAQAELRQVLAGPDEEDIIAAKAELDNADAKRRQAQARYDQVAGSPDIGRRPEALELEQATSEYNAALARYEAAQKGADPAEVSAARAKVDRAQAELEALLAPASAAEIAAAEAEVRRAQAELDLRLAGARDEEVAAAQADVAAAEASVDQARAALAEMELKAPFDGYIASLDVVLGQQVAAGERVVRLADFSSWRIETDDLTELEVVGIRAGDPVSATFDAIPDLVLPGQVLRIKSIGENKQGDITYTVIVVLNRLDERLLWNMTATVNIEPGKGPGLALSQPQAPASTPTPSLVPLETSPPVPSTLILSEVPNTVPLMGTERLATNVSGTVESTLSVLASGARPGGTAAAQPGAGVATSGTPTLEVSPTPTSSPASTSVPTSTPTAVVQPTNTPTRQAQPTSAPRVATPRPTATPTPSLALIPPDPIAPGPNESHGGVVSFSWLPTAPLPPGTAYEVVMWNAGEPASGALGVAAPTTQNSLQADLDALFNQGRPIGQDVYWTVLVVRLDPYERLIQPADSNWRVMRYQQPGSGGYQPPPIPRP